MHAVRAIQAAQMYPEAEVIAVDISPLPQRFVQVPHLIQARKSTSRLIRPLPANVKFQQLDLSSDSELPFGPETFDVVHIRFALIHVCLICLHMTVSLSGQILDTKFC
jgi:hypothetical protein